MAEGEPLLKDLFIQNEYRVVPPNLSLPKAAEIFSKTPGDTLLVYDKANDNFLGCLYLHDFHKAYSNPPKGKKSIEKLPVSEVMNTNLQEMNWRENVTQAWALVTTRQPHGIIIRDDSQKFVGFLSNSELMEEKQKLDSLSISRS